MGRKNTTYFIYIYFPDIDISGLESISVTIPIVGGYSFTPEFYTYTTTGSYIETSLPEISIIENRTTISYFSDVTTAALDAIDPSAYTWHIWLDFTRLSLSKVNGNSITNADVQFLQSNISMEASGAYTYRTNILNGLPMVYTANRGLIKSGGILTDDPIFVAAAVFITQSATYGRLISWGYSINEAWDVYCSFAGNTVTFHFATDTATAGAGPTLTSDPFTYPQGFIIAAWQKDDESMYLTIIDESGVRRDYGPLTGRGGGFTNFRLFDIYYPDYNWGFENYVGEIFVHNTEDEDLINGVIAYLGVKWISAFASKFVLKRYRENLYAPELAQIIFNVNQYNWTTDFTGSINSYPPELVPVVSSLNINTITPQFTGSINSYAPEIINTFSTVEINMWD